MFKIMSNIGDWSVLFESKYASPTLRKASPPRAVDLTAAEGLITESVGPVSIEMLAFRRGTDGDRDTVLLLLSDDPATALGVAGRLRGELGPELGRLVDAPDLREASKERLVLEEYCQSLDILCRPRHEDRIEPLRKSSRRMTLIAVVAAIVIVAAAGWLFRRSLSLGTYAEGIETYAEGVETYAKGVETYAKGIEKRVAHIENTGSPSIPDDVVTTRNLLLNLRTQLERQDIDHATLVKAFELLLQSSWQADARQTAENVVKEIEDPFVWVYFNTERPNEAKGRGFEEVFKSRETSGQYVVRFERAFDTDEYVVVASGTAGFVGIAENLAKQVTLVNYNQRGELRDEGEIFLLAYRGRPDDPKPERD